jgi:hypothetical protein
LAIYASSSSTNQAGLFSEPCSTCWEAAQAQECLQCNTMRISSSLWSPRASSSYSWQQQQLDITLLHNGQSCQRSLGALFLWIHQRKLFHGRPLGQAAGLGLVLAPRALTAVANSGWRHHVRLDLAVTSGWYQQ